ncbi:MAG: hypothetical protein II166_08555 [Firmicutes bacterium]|nr:hypothetical protein [Bacillota bacterium]
MLRSIQRNRIFIIIALLAVVVVLAAACGSSKGTSGSQEAQAEAPAVVKSEGVMTYKQYMEAEIGTEVVVETYVQAVQDWWSENDSIVVYSQDEEGAYFIYNLHCTEAEAAKLTKGTKIKVKGTKSEWFGEVEISDAVFEIEEGSYIAEPLDATDLFNTAYLESHKNQLVSLRGMTVEPMDDSGAAFYYSWDNSGKEGSDCDLYFKLSRDGREVVFVVEYYLCGEDSDVYRAVKSLKVGQKIDVECFLYWYNGVQPHVTSIVLSK